MGQGLPEAFPKDSTQVLAAASYPGATKAFHIHRRQTDCWVPLQGMLQVALADLREDSPTFGARNARYRGVLRRWQLLIPPGVANSYQVVGTEPALLVYLPDRFYYPQDEGRIPDKRPSKFHTTGRRSISKWREITNLYPKVPLTGRCRQPYKRVCPSCRRLKPCG